MFDQAGREGADRGAGLVRGVATIVVAGALLGLAQNYMARAGGPTRGLDWIRENVVLDDLESLQPGGSAAADPGAQAIPAEVAVLPPDMNDPMGIAAAPAGGDLPVIPDVGRPLQMQLPAVKRFFDAGAAVIVDARTADEYAEGHIPGAVHLDYERAVTDPALLESFDAQGKPIIVYCGGGTCEVSMNLAFAMIQAGQKKLLVHMGGWPEWQAAGYPVAVGPGADGEAR